MRAIHVRSLALGDCALAWQCGRGKNQWQLSIVKELAATHFNRNWFTVVASPRWESLKSGQGWWTIAVFYQIYRGVNNTFLCNKKRGEKTCFQLINDMSVIINYTSIFIEVKIWIIRASMKYGNIYWVLSSTCLNTFIK